MRRVLLAAWVATGCGASPGAVADAAADAADAPAEAAPGTDAAVRDAEPPDAADDLGAGRRCVTHADCDDGLFCTGVEQCAPSGYCVASRNPGCDDQVACTDDRCDEALDRCDFVPVGARCASGVCVPGEGCRRDGG